MNERGNGPRSGSPTGQASDDSRVTATSRVKRGLAEMLRGGVIMDVVDAEQAKVAEGAGAVSVMALERVPADIRRPFTILPIKLTAAAAACH